MILLLATAPIARASPTLFLDTDMSIDVDDVGMLCAAHALADRGEATILAVVHDTDLDAGVGAISVINHHFGRDEIPIGAYRGPVGSYTGSARPDWTQRGRGVYVDDLVANFPSPVRNYTNPDGTASVPSAVEVYRRTLAAAPDGSVVIVAVGFTTNLLDLLRSAADAHSPRGGVELVARKVQQLIVMGGRRHMRPGQPVEWNFGGCGTGCGNYDLLGGVTNHTFEAWPREVPVVYVGFESGVVVSTGGASGRRAWPAQPRGNRSRTPWALPAAQQLPPGEAGDSPCDRAYFVFCRDMHGWCNERGRCSWDPMALLYAVRGDPHGYYERERGVDRVDPRDGSNAWASSTDGREVHLVLDESKIAALEAELDELYLAKPALRRRPPTPPPLQRNLAAAAVIIGVLVLLAAILLSAASVLSAVRRGRPLTAGSGARREPAEYLAELTETPTEEQLGGPGAAKQAQRTEHEGTLTDTWAEE